MNPIQDAIPTLLHAPGHSTTRPSPGADALRSPTFSRTIRASSTGRAKLGWLFALALLPGLLAPCPLAGFSVIGYPSGFADIVAHPLDHWTWDSDTITYKFDPSFTAAFPDPDLKDQVRLAFRQWSEAHSPFRGSAFSYRRWNGKRNFGDIRSIAGHEIGHILSLHHPDQGDDFGLNFEANGSGGYRTVTALGTEVMNSGFGGGSYNRILSLDDLQGYQFIYGARNLNFVEVPAGAPAAIVIFTFTDTANIWARGGPNGFPRRTGGVGLPVPFGGAEAVVGGLKFNTACGTPIGIQTRGINWLYKSLTGRATRAITLRTSGTDNPNPISYFRNTTGSSAYIFDGFSSGLVAGLQEDQLHRWSNPRGGGPIPATESISIGLELDVWDWRLVDSGVEDPTGALSALTPFLTGSPWYHTSVTAGAGGGAARDGLTLIQTMMIEASGVQIESPVGALVSRLAVADVTGLGLRLSDLNSAMFSNLVAQQRVETIPGFGQRNLAPSAPFVLVFQGDVNDLPDDLQQSGNYLILNRPDLEDKDLLVFAEAETAEARVEMYAQVARTVIGYAGAPHVATTGREPDDIPGTATYLGAARSAIGAGSLLQPGDVDYFSFEAPYRARIWCTVDTGGPASDLGTSRDTLLTIYGIKGTDVLEVDDDDGSGNGGDATTETGLASAIAGLRTRNSGTHFLSVRAYNPASTVVPYTVFLTVTTETNSLGAEVESNDTPGLADAIILPDLSVGVRSAAIGWPGDVDYFTAYLPTGAQILHVSVDGDPERDGLGTDTVVDLLAADGTLLYTANSSALGEAGNPPAEGFNFVLPSEDPTNSPAGYRIVSIRVQGTSPNAIGTYDLMVASSPLTAPTLEIEREGSQVAVSWPLHAVGLRLMSCPTLGGPWTPVAASPQAADERYTIRLPLAGTSQFFRLMSR